jgi:hypothetical protein
MAHFPTDFRNPVVRQSQMKSIEKLISNLGEMNRLARLNALVALKEMGASALPAMAAIKLILHDVSEPYLQIVAAGAIGAIDGSDPNAVPVLIAALDDPILTHRLLACELLGERRDKSGVLITMKLLHDEYFTVKFAAAEAIGVTFGNWRHAICICLDMFQSDDELHHFVAAENLLSIKQHIQNDLDVVLTAISDASWEARIDLEEVLHQLRTP